MLKVYTVWTNDSHTMETQETVEDILFAFSGIRIVKRDSEYFQIVAGGTGERVINLLAECDLLEVYAGTIEELREAIQKVLCKN